MTATKTAPVQFERPSDLRDEITANTGEVRFIDVPKRRYLMIEGNAKPGAKGFQDAIATLFPVAYTLHFALKHRGVEAPIGALEGLFWSGKPGPLSLADFRAFAGPRVPWNWRLQLPVPDAAGREDIDAAIADVRAKGKGPLVDQLRVESWEEGSAAQLMHVGPYDAEQPTIERLHAAIDSHGLRPRGCHHEIYIGDPNRSKPDRLKTLIRQPVGLRET